MKQNKYDDVNFFAAYEQMPRSTGGLEAAGEWPTFQSLIPDLQNKDVLDLGCGFGWHCRYARAQHASTVIGIDISEKMLQKAQEKTDDPAISYVHMPIEDIAFTNSEFDVVISSLAFHYIKSFELICEKGVELFKTRGDLHLFCRASDFHFPWRTGLVLRWPGESTTLASRSLPVGRTTRNDIPNRKCDEIPSHASDIY